MRRKKIIVFFICFILTSFCHADAIYTWKDRDGNIHITDYPPPLGYESKVTEIPGGRQVVNEEPGGKLKEYEENNRKWDLEQKIKHIEIKAKKARSRAAKAENTARQAKDKASALLKKHGTWKKMRRYRRRAKRLNLLYDKAMKDAENAGKEALDAEKEADRLRQSGNIN